MIESDLVLSNPDKVTFLIKDMLATMRKSIKISMNPLWVGKLDLNSVNHFPFPQVNKSYFEHPEKGNQVDINFTRKFIEMQLRPSKGKTHFFPKLRGEEKKLVIPPMLLIFCNLVELSRLRENLILYMNETKMLEDVFNT